MNDLFYVRAPLARYNVGATSNPPPARTRGYVVLTRPRLLAIFVLLGTLPLPASQAAAQRAYGERCGAGVLPGEADGWIGIPEGWLFCPLAADPKAEHSHISYLRGDFPELTLLEDDTNVGWVGIGDDFPLFSLGGRE